MTANKLAKRIADAIAKQETVGWHLDKEGKQQFVRCMTFKQYMSLCLYDNEQGYYRSGAVRVGRAGDFYTSSGVGNVMAECMAVCMAEYGRQMSATAISVIEWGAGTGRFSVQLKDVWDKHACDNEGRIQLQQILVEDHPSHLQAASLAFEQLHSEAFIRNSVRSTQGSTLFLTSDQALHHERIWLHHPTVIIANELLDAFPVHRIVKVNGEIKELGVAGTIEDGFYYVHMPLSDSRIAVLLERDGITLLEGQQTEINLVAGEWIEELGQILDKGRIILIDYGHEAEEYTADHRMKGTLMCYWEHKASDHPFIRIGQQDITAHVPFTFVRRAAEDAGWTVSYFNTQKQFLVDYGVFDLLQSHDASDPFSQTSKRNRAIRQLLLSDGMSETFKVMILDK
ncbi:MAG: class I SAM-dependent methyltransferase [Candidatus Pristimantibacillus sp.]